MTQHASPHPVDAGAPHAHVLPPSVLLGTGAALLTLTAITVTVSRVDLGKWNVVAALAVACTKATLVALFFMHLKYEERFQTVILIGSAFFVIFLAAFVLFDTVQYQPDIRAKAAADQAAKAKVVGRPPGLAPH